MSIQAQPIAITLDDLQDALEPLIRRVVREELAELVNQQPDIFYLEPHMPLYADMEDILQRKTAGQVTLYSDDEVWNE